MSGGIFEKNKIKEKIIIFDNKISQKDFWKDKLCAQKILKEKKFFDDVLSNFNSTINDFHDLEQLLQLASRENEIEVIKDCEKKNIFIIKTNKKN